MLTHNEIWNTCLEIIRAEIAPDTFNTWFHPIKPVRFENKVLTIQVPSQFFYEYLEAHFLNLLRKAVVGAIGQEGKLEYSIVIFGNQNGNPTTVKMPVASDNSGSKPNPVNPPINTEKEIPSPFAMPGIKRVEIESNLNPAQTFANFVEGDCNRLAKSASFAVANKPGGTAYNPLFLFGGAGLGKTHLMQAIGNEIKMHQPQKTVLYIPSEQFINHYMDSVRSSSLSDFMNYYQLIDILLVDDIQFLSGKEKTQEHFFHVFNQMRQAGKQIVMASDRPAQELEGIEDRLISRFRWGLSASLEVPDFNTRLSILKTKMYHNGIEMPPDVVEYLANHITNNIRELEGALISLLAHSSFSRQDVDIDLARNMVSSFVDKVAREISIEAIQKVVCDFLGVDLEALKAASRKREIVQARQLAMYFAKELTNQSLKTIGVHFGGRDHSTVIHSLQTVNNLMATDREFQKQVEMIRKKLNVD